MLRTSTKNKSLRQRLGRMLMLGVLVYIVIATVVGTWVLVTARQSQPPPLLSISDYARLLRDNLHHTGVLEYCQPFRCFDRDRGYQGLRVLTP